MSPALVGPVRSASARWWATRPLAIWSAAVGLAGISVLIAVAGRDALDSTDSAAGVARAAALVALPGLVLAVLAPRLDRRWRAVGGVVAAGLVGGLAALEWDDGGPALVPAAVLLVAAAVATRAVGDQAPEHGAVRADLLVAATLAAIVGVVLRAANLETLDDDVSAWLNQVAVGSVLVAWPVLLCGVLSPRRLPRGVVVVAALLMAGVVFRAPLDGEAWLVPAALLALLAALASPPPVEDAADTDTSDADGDEADTDESEADGGEADGDEVREAASAATGPDRPTVRWPDGSLVGLAAVGGVLVGVGHAAGTALGRDGSTGRELAVDMLAALVPVAVAVLAWLRPADGWWRVLTPVVALAGVVVTAAGIEDRPSAAALVLPPALVLVACRPRASVVATVTATTASVPSTTSRHPPLPAPAPAPSPAAPPSPGSPPPVPSGPSPAAPPVAGPMPMPVPGQPAIPGQPHGPAGPPAPGVVTESVGPPLFVTVRRLGRGAAGMPPAPTPAGSSPASPARPVSLPGRSVAAGMAAIVVALGLVVSPAPARGGPALDLPSGRIDDAQVAIDAADARFLRDTVGVADLVPGARCYFVLGESVGYAPVVACGPVFHDQGAPLDPDVDPGDPTDVDDTTTTTLPTPAGGAGHWDLYAARADGGRLRLDDPQVGQDLPVELLTRPDDLRPADVGDVDDPGTAAITAAPGFVGRLYEDPPDTRSAGGYVLAGTGRVTVEQVAQPDVVVADDGLGRQAPVGYRLVAARLAFEEVTGTTLEVVSGAERIDVTDVVAPGLEFYEDGWVVGVVRDDVVDPVLEVSHRGRSQRISLGTGERLGGDPLLYGPLEQVLDVQVDGADVVVQAPDPAPHPVEVSTSSYSVDGALLTTFDPGLGWAAPGQAWLVVAVGGLGNISWYDPDGPDTDTDDPVVELDTTGSFVVETAAGNRVTPSGTHPTDEGSLAVVFAVDEDLRSASFRSAPRWWVGLTDEPLTVAAPPVATPIRL